MFKSTCPICGSKNVETKITTETFEYKGEECIIDGCEVLSCNDCEESFFENNTSRKIEKALLREFRREVDDKQEK